MIHHSDIHKIFIWQGRGATTSNYKHHLLVEQKLLHFVNVFHQYVMDQVNNNSFFLEPCLEVNHLQN